MLHGKCFSAGLCLNFHIGARFVSLVEKGLQLEVFRVICLVVSIKVRLECACCGIARSFSFRLGIDHNPVVVRIQTQRFDFVVFDVGLSRVPDVLSGEHIGTPVEFDGQPVKIFESV